MTWSRKFGYAGCARRLRRRLDRATVPRHLAMMMDGNRRWARQRGFEEPRAGHRYGAEHLDEVLGWCAETGNRCSYAARNRRYGA